MDINNVYEVDIYEITSILIAKGVVAKTQAKFIKRTVIYKNEEWTRMMYGAGNFA